MTERNRPVLAIRCTLCWNLSDRPEMREIPGALPEAMIFIPSYSFAAVAAAIQAALFRFNQRVNNV